MIYGNAITTMWCQGSKNIEGRNGCTDDKECLENARDQCDKDPDCFGVSWLSNKIEQKSKLCLSKEMEPKRDGWRTMMKLNGNNMINIEFDLSNFIIQGFQIVIIDIIISF